MRLHRFFIATTIDKDQLDIKDERLIHQWRNVFRYNVGSEVIIFDGGGYEYDCVFKNLNNRGAVLEVISKRVGIMPKNPSGGGQEITLYQSIIKKDKMEWVVEKATELGISKIVPVISERSEKKNLNLDRIRKIVIEASEQCGRADVPEVGEVMNLESGIMNYAGAGMVFDPSGAPFESSLLATSHSSLSVFIGPEGGWSDRELKLFKQKEAEVYSLSPLTLRSETATIVALVLVSVV